MNAEAELRFFECHEEYAPSLEKFVREHKDEYAAILPVCYYFSSTVCTVLAAPEKCILIPTAHPEKPLYYAIYTQIFTRVAHIAFNTAAERRLCRRIFGCRMSPNSLVGCGIEKAAPAAWDSVKSRYGLPEHYVLYVGRMHPQKISNVISDFLRYKQEHGGDIKLVMAGPGDPKIATVVSPEIIFTDAVSEAEKERTHPPCYGDGQSFAAGKSLAVAARSAFQWHSHAGERQMPRDERPLQVERERRSGTTAAGISATNSTA